jgi:hypothetical protein
MSEKCVTCGLLFRTSNELDWHIREEHMRGASPPGATTEREPDSAREREPDAAREREPDSAREREPDSAGGEPSGRPRWLSAARRLFGRRSPESR